jgi:hypothetical protein
MNGVSPHKTKRKMPAIPNLLALRWSAIFLIFFAPGLVCAQQPTGAEKYLFESVNHERTERGLRPLKWDAALAEAAKRHTELMAKHKSLSHDFPGEAELQVRTGNAGAHFRQVAENIGEATELEDLHYGWMHSPPHRANILSSELTSIGIAVLHSGDTYYATQDFSAAVAELSIGEQEKQIAKLIEKYGLHVKAGSEEARNDCAGHSGVTSGQPRAVAHFETPDLSVLPEGFAKTLSRGRYSAAAVGACPTKQSGGFTSFKFTVFLY